ncbi:MAG: protoporphyrinogen oxidase [Candidatus Sumerlaeia bacterium]|nr:protoporphyrinogen oxidase [Candidatus Sumerlaeia bacterium]
MATLAPSEPRAVLGPPVHRTCALVIGAGISGLVSALRLHRAGVDVTVLETAAQPGGVIDSCWDQGHLLERGPNSVLLRPELEALIAGLGLAGPLQVTPMRDHPRFIYRRGCGLLPVPVSPMAFVRSRLLSWRAKLRLLREPFLIGSPRGEESVASFAERHLGREMAETFIAPFVSGIYAGDPRQMSLPGALPRMRALAERGHGSLVRGAISKMLAERRAASGPPRRPSSLCSFPSGLAQIPAAIACELGDRLRCGWRAIEVSLREGGSWRVRARHASGECAEWRADALILATPPRDAAELLEPCVPQAAVPLRFIGATSLVTVHLAVPITSLARPAQGFGFLVPRGQGLRILGALHSSAVFPGRAPEGTALLTVFLGGATDPGAIEADDAAIRMTVRHDLQMALGWNGECRLARITRHRAALPAYDLGHVARIRAAERAAAAAPAPLALAGNYLHGISLADCVTQANTAAAAILARRGVPA